MSGILHWPTVAHRPPLPPAGNPQRGSGIIATGSGLSTIDARAAAVVGVPGGAECPRQVVWFGATPFANADDEASVPLFGMNFSQSPLGAPETYLVGLGTGAHRAMNLVLSNQNPAWAPTTTATQAVDLWNSYVRDTALLYAATPERFPFWSHRWDHPTLGTALVLERRWPVSGAGNYWPILGNNDPATCSLSTQIACARLWWIPGSQGVEMIPVRFGKRRGFVPSSVELRPIDTRTPNGDNTISISLT